MIDELRAMAIFAETAQRGSFRGAARALGLSPSVVSYHISQLEKRLGTALIYRSTRKLSLTAEGETLVVHAREMLASARLGLSQVAIGREEWRGKLTVTLPSALIRAPISQAIAEFSKLHPAIELQLCYTDVRQNLIADGIDLALRAGQLDSSGLKSLRLGSIARKLVCSSDYWTQHSAPRCLQDVALWHWIRLAMLPDHRSLRNEAGQREQISFASHVTVDSVEAMTQMCLCGLGLATPPDYLVQGALTRGDLVEVLPAWTVEPIPVYAVWPANVTVTSNTRRLLDYLVEAGASRDL